MKRFFFGVFLLVVSVASALAQTTEVSVSGQVIDQETQEPIPQATLQLLRLPDSTYVNGAASNARGYFQLPKVRAGNYALKVSYIGYKSQVFTLSHLNADKNMGIIKLASDAVLLQEAVVTAEAAKVQVIEDTLLYNSAAYRTPQGAMLEELVKKLPGAEVDDSGNVKINGKDLKKILVNGKEFFGGDVQTGLKNLPVEMVDQLKTYDKKSDLARVTGIDDGEEETVLDLTVKKGMNKGIFGNIDVSAGTEDRYMNRAMINQFSDNSQLSVIASANNTNDMGFSGGGGGPRFMRNNGLTARKTLGVDFATMTSKIELGGSARYDYSDNDLQSIGYTQNFLTNRSSYVNSNQLQRNKTNRFNFDFRLEWKPDTLTNIIFRPNLSYSRGKNLSNSLSGTFTDDPFNLLANPNDYLDVDNLSNDPLEAIRTNASDNGSYNKSEAWSGNGTLQINRKLNNQGRNITFRGRFGYNDNENDSYTQSLTRYYQLQNYLGTDSVLVRNQYINTPTNSYNYSAQLTYSEPIAKATFLQMSYQFQYIYNTSDRRTYDLRNTGWSLLDPLPASYLNNEIDSLGKYAEYRYYNHEIELALRFIREKYQLSAGVRFQPQHTVLSYKKGDYMIDTARNVFNFAPSIDLRYRFSKVSQLRLQYRGRNSQPGMDNLLPIVDNSNPMNIRIGNPGLKPSFSHNVMLFFNSFNAENQRSYIVHANLRATQNSVSNSRIYNEETGGWTSMPKNINGNWNAFGMFGFNTALKNKKFTLSSFGNLSYSNNVGYLTDYTTKIENKNTTTNLNVGERLNLTYRNAWLELGANGSINYSVEKDKLNSENNQKPYTYSYGGNVQFTLPWNMALSTNITNQSRRGYTDSSMNRNELIWNAQLSQTLFKGSTTVSFEMYDILQKQSNIMRSYSSTGRSVYSYNGVNSYCMVHVLYRLNIFGGKDARNQMRDRRGGFPGGFPGGFGGGYHGGGGRPGGGGMF